MRSSKSRTFAEECLAWDLLGALSSSSSYNKEQWDIERSLLSLLKDLHKNGKIGNHRRNEILRAVAACGSFLYFRLSATGLLFKARWPPFHTSYVLRQCWCLPNCSSSDTVAHSRTSSDTSLSASCPVVTGWAAVAVAVVAVAVAAASPLLPHYWRGQCLDFLELLPLLPPLHPLAKLSIAAVVETMAAEAVVDSSVEGVMVFAALEDQKQLSTGKNFDAAGAQTVVAVVVVADCWNPLLL